MPNRIEPVTRLSPMPRFRVLWGAEGTAHAQWHGGLIGFHVKGYPRKLWILISIRGVLRWAAGLAAISFLVGTAVAAILLSRNPYNQIGYFDLVLPTRWPAVRTKRGLGLIDEGLRDLHTGDYRAGLMLLDRGLALAPAALRARIALGQFYAQSGQVHRALQLYRDGLQTAGTSRNYLEAVFGFARYLEDYDAVLALVQEVETQQPRIDEALRRWLDTQRFDALVKLERYPEVIQEWQRRVNAPLSALDVARARSLAALGQTDQALEFVEANPQRFGLPQERWELVLSIAQTAGRPEAAAEALGRLMAIDPSNPKYYAMQIADRAERGATGEACRLVHDYFLRFGFQPLAIKQLLQKITESPSAEVLSAAWDETNAAGGAVPANRVLYVQGLILLGRIGDAAVELERCRTEIEGMRLTDDGWLEGTQALLELLRADSPASRTRLFTYCAHRPLGPTAFRFLYHALVRNDRGAMANEIALLAKNRFYAIAGLNLITLAPPAAPPTTRVPPTLPPIPISVPASATPISAESEPVPELTPEQVADELAKFETDLSVGRWDEAQHRLQILGRSPDENLASELLFRRLQLHAEQSALSELMGDLLRLVAGKKPALDRLRTLSVGLHRRGKGDSALVIVLYLVRNRPEAEWATQLQREWNKTLRVAPLEAAKMPPLRQ
jgi:tetratricopeptide (TPR) repeat protein